MIGARHPGDDVEKRCLAGAIGSYQPGNGPPGHLERAVIDCRQPAIALGDSINGDYCVHRLCEDQALRCAQRYATRPPASTSAPPSVADTKLPRRPTAKHP